MSEPSGSTSLPAEAVAASPAVMWALIVLLTGLVFSAYFPALRGGFVWDDNFYAANPVLAEPGSLIKIWTLQPAGSMYYREFPLVYTTLWVERRLWGLDPTGFHVVNVTLHVMNAVLVWLVLRCLAVPGAWLAAAIFALHPLQVESVAWLSERKNVLCGLFFLSAALAYIRFEDGKGQRWYWGALALFAGACLSKPIAVVLPLVLLLLRWARGRRTGSRELIRVAPFFVLAFGVGILTLVAEATVIGGEHQRAEFSLSPLQRILCAARSFWFYPEKLFLPVDLAFSYERWSFDVGDPGQWLRVIATVAAAAAAWRFRERVGRKVLAGLGYYAISIAPVLGFVNLYTFRYAYVADHYQYLASLGLIAVVVGSLATAIRRDDVGWTRPFRKHRRWVEGVLVVVVLAPLWAATWRQAHDYESAETLLRNTVRKSPGSSMARNELAFIHYRRGELEQAEMQLREAIRLTPDDAEPHANLGLVLAASGKLDEAASHYRRALEIRFDNQTLQGLKSVIDRQVRRPR